MPGRKPLTAKEKAQLKRSKGKGVRIADLKKLKKSLVRKKKK